MKQLKLMLLMAFFSLGFSAISFGQATTTEPTNTITRNACLAGYSGCYSGAVKLTLTSNSGLGSSYTFSGATESRNYSAYNKKIKITINGATSTGTYYLPTAIGEQLIMTGSECGLPAYNIHITKTANGQYTLGVFYGNQ
ncbi:hypothetical protein F0919_04505 [Taibaiella lutea]|uniref:Uncharacterized protein n=1 Tax=Taibaiella lutea TaxID=2608001 RepID=A0A5M6CRD9_9BACT|nr:hypothetical protein [Taibaiella lutea]KAA5536940.1 hypothetical protein F0919_04505 [Taibaiella lutea]